MTVSPFKVGEIARVTTRAGIASLAEWDGEVWVTARYGFGPHKGRPAMWLDPSLAVAVERLEPSR